MTDQFQSVPTASYGILQQEVAESTVDCAAEQIRNFGYAIIESGYTLSQVQQFSEEFDRVRKHYVDIYGADLLRSINELHTIRALFTQDGAVFKNLIFNQSVAALIKQLIPGKYILNQQNGIVNPPKAEYSQGLWHRDLPYQHFSSSKPLAINFLFCIDDFTFENGGTFVLPASHKLEAFPSASYIKNNAVQVKAPAGSFIVMDCMLFHSGGANKTQYERRAVNHIFNVPFFKQQVNLSQVGTALQLTEGEKDILGFNNVEPTSVAAYFAGRSKKVI